MTIKDIEKRIIKLENRVRKLEFPIYKVAGQKIEVLHGAPSDERISEPPAPQVPGQAPK